MAGPLIAASKVDHEAECTYKQLTWDDFRGATVDGPLPVSIEVAIVLKPVSVEVADKQGGGAIARARNPTVYALMNKLESAVRPGGRTEQSLEHAQIHFDLTEFLARRLSRELRELSLEGAARSEELQRGFLLAVEQRFKETLADLERLQEQFQEETSQGEKAGAQRKWAKKAAKLLESEPPYELR